MRSAAALTRSAATAERLRESSRRLRAAIEEASHVPGDWRPVADSWCLTEVVTHLNDSLIAASLRYRHLLTESEPELAAYAHVDWVTVQQADELPLDLLLDTHAAFTRYNARLLERLTDEQYERVGCEGEHRYTLRHISEVFTVAHMNGHLHQIRRIQAAYDQSREGS